MDGAHRGELVKYGWLTRRRDRRDLLVLLACETLHATGRGANGYSIQRLLGRGPGVYRPLARLEAGALLTSDWETPEPLPNGRPRRRLYVVTEEGRRRVADLTERLTGPAPAYR
jgi:DNA-binding PadR family transcriptional regulator